MGAAAAPMIIGSAIGAAINRKNPLQGALLGGALGGFGGSFMGGLGSAGTASATSAAGSAAMHGVAGGAVAPGAFGAGVVSPPPFNPTAIFANPTSAIGGTTSAVSGPSTGLIPASIAPTFMERFTGGLNDIGQFTKDYPIASQMAFQTGQSLLSQQPQQPPPPGLMRGTPTQMQPRQYQVGVPQVSLI